MSIHAHMAVRSWKLIFLLTKRLKMNYTLQNIVRRFNLFYDFQECKKRGKYWRNFKFTQAVELMPIAPPSSYLWIVYFQKSDIILKPSHFYITQLLDIKKSTSQSEWPNSFLRYLKALKNIKKLLMGFNSYQFTEG